MRLCFLIPAYCESKTIHKSIYSCLNAGVSRNDIYVIDDGSTDDTAWRAKRTRVHVHTKANGGKATALHRGVDHFRLDTTYTHVAILDADSAIDVDYVDTMMDAAAKTPEASLLCGSPRSQRKNWLTAYRAVEYGISAGIYKEAQSFMGVVSVAPGCASVYKLADFVKLDFSGDTLVEDMDLTIQLQRKGAAIVHVPGAFVYTQDPSTIKGYIGQMLRWYRGTWQVVRKHRLGRCFQRIDLEVALLLGEGLYFPLLMLLLLYTRGFYFGMGMLFDQLLLLALTVLIAARERRWDVILAFPTFFIPRALNGLLFIYAFFAERKTHATQWFSVERY